ncbi:MAG TPA: PEGA domain-containing protein [Vicinamibacterales bacterium]|nr:PEGA domain-containing protein [Vicinamibacterales bacterium]
MRTAAAPKISRPEVATGPAEPRPVSPPRRPGRIWGLRVKLIKSATGAKPEAPPADPLLSFQSESAPAEPALPSPAVLPSRRVRLRRVAIVLLSLVAAGLAVTLGWRYAGRVTLLARPEARLTFSSTPPGAEVLIDGRRRGVTPLSLLVADGRYTITLRHGSASRSFAVAATSGREITHHIELAAPAVPTGGLAIASDPPGARVVIDGRPAGTTPLDVGGLAPGRYLVAVSARGTTVQREVAVAGGVTTPVLFSLPREQGPASGWLVVASPLEVQLFDGDALIGSSRNARLLLPAGRRRLVARNEAVGYERAFSVDLAAGQTTRVSLPVPDGTLNINALPWAEVWVDGRRVGETPIANLAVPLGSHEIVLRHPRLGERRQTVLVTASAPARVGVDLRKP